MAGISQHRSATAHQHLRELLNNLPGLVLEADAEGRILYLNRCAEGYRVEDLLGTFLWEWIDTHQKGEVQAALKFCFSTGKTASYTCALREGIAPNRVYAARIGPIHNAEHHTTALIVCQDITDQLEAEAALAASERRWRTLVENMPGYVVLLNGENSIRFINHHVANLGFHPHLHRSIFDYVLPADVDTVRAALEKARANGEPQSFEARVQPPGGSLRYFACRAAAMPRGPGDQTVLILAIDITQQVESESALAQSESRLRQVIDLVPHQIFARDRDGRFLMVNEATAAAYGTTVETLTGRLTAEVHTLEDERESFLQDDQRVLESQQATCCARKPFTNAAGDRRLLQTHMVPFRLPGADEPVVLGVGIDVTEQKNALAALQASEEKYRSLVENLNDIIYIQDTAGIIRYISPVVERLGGYKTHELTGQPSAKFVHPEDLPALLKSRERTLAGQYEPTEFRVFDKEGRIRYVRTSSRLLWEDEKVVGITGILTDITRQKRSELAMRESEQRYRSIYSLAPLAIVLWDMKGRVLDWNKRAEALFGWKKDDVLGKRLCEFIVPPSARDRVEQAFKLSRSGRNSWSMNENLTQDGSIILCEWNNCVYLDDAGETVHMVSVVLDVTERTREQERRSKMDAQIQHTQKLESLGVLAGGIAHDFNNLLVGIIGNTDFALSDLPEDSPVREHLQDVGLAAQRAAELCRQLLAYSGKGRFVVLPLDLRDIVHEMTQLLELSIARKAQLQLDFADELPAIEADPTQIRQVVMNLVSNASEAFEKRSGAIRVSVKTLCCDPDFFSGSYLRERLPAGDYVVLEVSDDGCGMDAETQQKIFEPFFTTKFAGRGLGMAAVLGIVRGHHGSIKLYSEPGRGTTVSVYFPACDGLYLEKEQPGEDELPDWRGEGMVLVVDDDERVLRTARKFLERTGYRVITAEDGFQGIDLCQQYAHELSLIILDMTMPKLSGFETFQRLRQLSPHVPIVLSSGYNEQDALARFTGKGLAGFLQKPYPQREFLAKIREVTTRNAADAAEKTDL